MLGVRTSGNGLEDCARGAPVASAPSSESDGAEICVGTRPEHSERLVGTMTVGPLPLLPLVLLLSSPCLSLPARRRATTATPSPPEVGAWHTGFYRNLFLEAGYTQDQVDTKLNAAYAQLHYGDDDTERLFYWADSEHTMGYIYSPASDDVRTEGMSYGMMINLQMNKRTVFGQFGPGGFEKRGGAGKGGGRANTDGEFDPPPRPQ